MSSIAFNNYDPIPPRYTAKTNPPLDISDVPDSAKSLALIMHDPDAIHGEYTHWTIWDIATQTTTILEDTMPRGAVIGHTSAGTLGYLGPCPPAGSGRHRYVFDLYALNSMLNLSPETPIHELMRHINEHVIEKTSLIGVVDA